MFPTSVSYFHPDTVSIIFIHCMETVTIIRKWDKEFSLIIKDGESINMISDTKEMAARIRLGVYCALSCGAGLSSLVMGGRFRSDTPK